LPSNAFERQTLPRQQFCYSASRKSRKALAKDLAAKDLAAEKEKAEILEAKKVKEFEF